MQFMKWALVDLKKGTETCWDAVTNQTLKRFRNSNEKNYIYLHLFLLCFPENVKLKQCSAENSPLLCHKGNCCNLSQVTENHLLHVEGSA